MNSTFTFVCSNVLPFYIVMYLMMWYHVEICGIDWLWLTIVHEMQDLFPTRHLHHIGRTPQALGSSGLALRLTARCLDGPWRMSGSPFLTTDLNFNQKIWTTLFWNILDMSWYVMSIFVSNDDEWHCWYTMIYFYSSSSDRIRRRQPPSAAAFASEYCMRTINGPAPLVLILN